MELFEEATQLHQEGRYEEALEKYDMLLSQNNENSGLLATVGTLFLQNQKPGLAITLLEQSLAKGKRTSDVLCNLGIAYKQCGLRDTAMKRFEEACSNKNDPSPEAMANYGAMFIEHEEREKGKKLCQTTKSQKIWSQQRETIKAHRLLAQPAANNSEAPDAWLNTMLNAQVLPPHRVPPGKDLKSDGNEQFKGRTVHR